MRPDTSLKKDFENRFKEIFAKEQSLARTVAHTVIKARPVSAWEVMIPILLIFSYAKSRETKEIFTQNFLFTKQIALKGAREMIGKGRSKDEVVAGIDEETRKVLASVKEGLYSEEVRQRQMGEIALLMDHYHSLLRARGDDYASWVRSVYLTLDNYTAFLERLREAEKEVYRASVQTVGSPDSDPVVARMEASTRSARMAAAEEIFRTVDRQNHADP